MALIGFAGFEDNNRIEIIPVGAPTISASAKRTGTYGLSCYGYNYAMLHGWIMRVDRDEFYFQYAMTMSATATLFDDYLICQWINKDGIVMGGFYQRSASKTIDIYIGAKTTKIGVTVTPFPVTPNWLVVEGYIKIADSDGRVVIKCNGITECDFTGDTLPATTTETEIAILKHGNIVDNVGSAYTYFDDIIINDTTGASFNSWPMGIKCHKVAAPSGNGTYTDWTASAGADYECIDDTPPTMDDYLSGTTGDKESFEFGNAPSALTGIGAVVTRFYGQGNGDIKRLCRLNSVDYLSTAFPLPGTFGLVNDVMTERPGGGGWDETTFNACEFGMEHQ